MWVYGFFSLRPRALMPAMVFRTGASAVSPCITRTISSVSSVGMPRQAVHATLSDVVGVRLRRLLTRNGTSTNGSSRHCLPRGRLSIDRHGNHATLFYTMTYGVIPPCVPHTVPRKPNRTRLHYRDRLWTDLDRTTVRDCRLRRQTFTASPRGPAAPGPRSLQRRHHRARAGRAAACAQDCKGASRRRSEILTKATSASGAGERCRHSLFAGRTPALGCDAPSSKSAQKNRSLPHLRQGSSWVACHSRARRCASLKSADVIRSATASRSVAASSR